MINLDAKIPLDKAVQVTENHGGFTGGKCVICEASGWIEGRHGLRYGTPAAREWGGTFLVHTESCSVNPHAAEKRAYEP